MNEPYVPKSDFIWMVVDEEVSLTGSVAADHNLQLLIGFTRDQDKSNRDWATMALGMYGPATDEVRDALLAAADDEDADVRGEAIEALARRDVKLALPLVKRELQRVPCGCGVFRAAGIVADRSLVELLKPYDFKSAAPWIDSDIREAIAACEANVPIEHWRD